MNVDATGSPTSITAAAGAPPNEELGKDAFMQLLVSQLQNQDPINPQSNEDFIAQLAQFSSLEAQNNLNDSFLGLAVLQQSNALMSQLTEGSSLIGQNVKYDDPNTGESLTGTVDSIRIQDGIAVLNVGGTDVPLLQVTEVTGTDDAQTGDEGTGDEGTDEDTSDN
jgi:flagellar basal-body rod modification protein FlgD